LAEFIEASHRNSRIDASLDNEWSEIILLAHKPKHVKASTLEAGTSMFCPIGCQA